MSYGKFAQETAITWTTEALCLFIGIGSSIVLARVLGPEGKGIYALATLLPSLIVTFGNLGIGSGTVYYVARGDFRWQTILGNNVLLSLGTSVIGILAGLVIVFFFREGIFPGVAVGYLVLAMAFVPAEMFFSHMRYVLLGAQRIKEFNYIQIAQSAFFLGFLAIALLGLRAGVTGAIVAGLITWLIIDIIIFRLAKTVSAGIDMKPDTAYIKRVVTYGIQAHLSNILGFLNYRVDMFLVNAFLGPAAVGLYTVGVGLVEKLWMLSFAASTVLFPRVAAETEEKKRKEFTPLVARTVLWSTAVGALILALVSRWVVVLLYSEAFLPAASALQALLMGIIALSAGRVLANDIAGRGLPRLNIYTGAVAVLTNVAMNILWIPKLGIVGAAWASTVSYTVLFLGSLFFYCRLSGNRWTVVVLPQQEDWVLYAGTGKALLKQALGKVRAAL